MFKLRCCLCFMGRRPDAYRRSRPRTPRFMQEIKLKSGPLYAFFSIPTFPTKQCQVKPTTSWAKIVRGGPDPSFSPAILIASRSEGVSLVGDGRAVCAACAWGAWKGWSWADLLERLLGTCFISFLVFLLLIHSFSYLHIYCSFPPSLSSL